MFDVEKSLLLIVKSSQVPMFDTEILLFHIKSNYPISLGEFRVFSHQDGISKISRQVQWLPAVTAMLRCLELAAEAHDFVASLG